MEIENDFVLPCFQHIFFLSENQFLAHVVPNLASANQKRELCTARSSVTAKDFQTEIRSPAPSVALQTFQHLPVTTGNLQQLPFRWLCY